MHILYRLFVRMTDLSRLYRDQLALTERHLDGLIDDANSTLKLLTSLADSFKAVESQTSTFQSQCENLLDEQRRLENLAHDVGTDLRYYEYLETVTRRLNAPGASKMVDDESFGEMIDNIDACVVFMTEHVSFMTSKQGARADHRCRRTIETGRRILHVTMLS